MTNTLKHQLRAYAEFLDEALPSLDPEQMARTGELPSRSPVEPRPVRTVPGWAWAVVAGLAAVVLFGVVVLLFRPTDPRESDVVRPTTTLPATTVTSPPTTVDAAPPVIPPAPDSDAVSATTVPSGFPDDSFTIRPTDEQAFEVASVVGQLTWTPVDEWDQFPPLPVAEVDGTYVADWGWGLGSLASHDGLDWSFQVGPTSAHQAGTDGSYLYAFSERSPVGGPPGLSVWRHDKGFWMSIPLPEQLAADVDGLTIVPSVIVQAVGPHVLLSLEAETEAWYFDLFHPEDSPFVTYYQQDSVFPLYDVERDVLVLPHHDFGETGEIVATLTVELAGQPPHLEFRDESTGELAHQIRADSSGLTPEEFRRAVLNRDLFEIVGVERGSVFISVEGAGFVPLEKPGVLTSNQWAGEHQIANLGTALIALLDTGALWESADGQTWSEMSREGLPAVDGDAQIIGTESRLLLMMDEDIWGSTDARTWRRAEGLVGEQTMRVHEADFGWTAITGGPFGSPVTVYLSIDGWTWTTTPLPQGTCWAEFAGDTIFGIACNEDRTAFTRWTAAIE